MEHNWKKATLIPAVAAKTGTRQNFQGGGGVRLLRKAVRHPSWTTLVIIFIWFDKGHIVINSLKNHLNFSTWLTREMLIWPENSTQGINNFEDFHYLHWRLVADFFTLSVKGQSTSRTWYVIFNVYPYIKPQLISTSHFCTKLWSNFNQSKISDWVKGVSDWVSKVSQNSESSEEMSQVSDSIERVHWMTQLSEASK